MLIAGGIVAFLFAGVSAVAFLPTGVEIDDDTTDDTPPDVPEYDGDLSLLNDIVTNAEGGEVDGTDAADRLLASTGVDIFNAGEGNDFAANGLQGDDQFFMGAGNDYANGGPGDDRIDGNGDDDTLRGGAGNDELNGLFHNDYLDGGRGEDLLRGGVGDDILVGRQDDDTLYAGRGNDEAYGGGGRDFIVGGDGNDALFGGGQKDIIDGGNGNDTIAGGWWADRIDGGAGDDTIFGEAGQDVIFGRSGNDIIFGGTGDDRVEDNGGADIVSLGNGHDYIRNGWGDDVVFGDAGDDVMIDGVGDDTYFGGAGADDMRDGAGDDIYFAVALEEGGAPAEDTYDGDRIVLKSGLDLVFAGQDDQIIFQGGDGVIALGDYGQATAGHESASIRNLTDDSSFAYFYAQGEVDAPAPDMKLVFDPESDLTRIMADGLEVGMIEGGNWEDRGVAISTIPYDPALIADDGIEALQELLIGESIT